MTNRSDEMVTITEPGVASSQFLEQTAANNFMDAQPSIMPMPHSMDFHSGTVAASDKWRSIAPGQTIEFDFVANYPGTYIYHSGTPSVLMHIAMGQHCVMVVSPKDVYTDDYEVDREYVVVQSEYYLRPGAGDLYQYDLEGAQNVNPSHVAFNGHQSILHIQTLKANAGERVRIQYSNYEPRGQYSFPIL